MSDMAGFHEGTAAARGWKVVGSVAAGGLTNGKHDGTQTLVLRALDVDRC